MVTLDELHARAARRRALATLAVWCLAAIAVVALARFGIADSVAEAAL
jgi:hypothetical protein